MEEKTQTVTIEQQKKITMTSVESVDSFSTQQITLTVEGGRAVITGDALKIVNFSQNQRKFRCGRENFGTEISRQARQTRQKAVPLMEDTVNQIYILIVCLFSGITRRRFVRAFLSVPTADKQTRRGNHRGYSLFSDIRGNFRSVVRHIRFPRNAAVYAYGCARRTPAVPRKFTQNTCFFDRKVV